MFATDSNRSCVPVPSYYSTTVNSNDTANNSRNHTPVHQRSTSLHQPSTASSHKHLHQHQHSSPAMTLSGHGGRPGPPTLPSIPVPPLPSTPFGRTTVAPPKPSETAELRLPNYADEFTDLDEEIVPVQLTRRSAKEDFGIILCYYPCDEEEDFAEVFVSRVVSNSIADISGNVYVGDQVLQINGEEIYSYEQSLILLHSSLTAVGLLLARPRKISSSKTMPNSMIPSTAIPRSPRLPDLACIQNASSIDLTHSRSLQFQDSARNLPVSNQQDTDNEYDDPDCMQGLIPEPIPGMLGNPSLTHSPSLEDEVAHLNRELYLIRLQCDELHRKHLDVSAWLLQRKLLTGCDSEATTPTSLFSRSPLTPSTPLRQVPKMGTRVDTPELGRKAQHSTNQPPPRRTFSPPSQLSNRNHNNNNSIGDHSTTLLKENEYNLYDSPSRHFKLPSKAFEIELDGSKKQSMALCDEISYYASACLLEANEGERDEEFNEEDIKAEYAQIMYTTPGQLAYTIQLQQMLFQRHLTLQRLRQNLGEDNLVTLQAQTQPGDADKNLPIEHEVNNSKKESDDSTPSKPCGLPDTPMEWVVKRRADGSRYITRRPVRNRILKERAKQVAEARCGQTTDEDTTSEIKLGRYWTRDERRKHLEKARHYRRLKKAALDRQLPPHVFRGTLVNTVNNSTPRESTPVGTLNNRVSNQQPNVKKDENIAPENSLPPCTLGSISTTVNSVSCKTSTMNMNFVNNLTANLVSHGMSTSKRNGSNKINITAVENPLLSVATV